MDTYSELVEIVLNPQKKQPEKLRYEGFKKLLKVSEETPETLYPYWDAFAKELEDANSDHKYEGVLILANIAKVDREGRSKKIIDRYIELLADKSFVVALNAANNVGKFAKTHKELRERITQSLLDLKMTKHKHKNLLMSGAIISFNEYFEDSQDKEKIRTFVKNLETGESPKARKLAKQFRKDHHF